MDRSIRFVRQPERDFETYCMAFKELKGKKVAASHHNFYAKKLKTPKVLKYPFNYEF
jgi:hypothetical protein